MIASLYKGVETSELEYQRSLFYPHVRFGSNVTIGCNVAIGAGSRIGNNVVLHDDVMLGCNARVDDGAILGKLPMKAKASAVTRHDSLEPTTIGDNCLIGSHAVIYRGAKIGDHVLIADLATVREQTQIGELTIVGRGVAVENQVSIGSRCKLETGSYITAMSLIEDYCFVAPEVTFTNDNFVGRTEERFKHFRGVTMRRGARIGANATVLPGITLGEDCLVAAGAVVTRDVAPRMIALGTPAREIRSVPEEQLLASAEKNVIAGACQA